MVKTFKKGGSKAVVFLPSYEGRPVWILYMSNKGYADKLALERGNTLCMHFIPWLREQAQ